LFSNIDYRLFALDAAYAGTAASLLYPLPGVRAGVHQMQLPHRAFVRIAHIGAAHARGVSWHGADFFADAGRVFAQADGVVVRLGHLLPIQSGHLGSRGEHGLRLGQDHLAAASDTKQPPR
jgi:hypothetical protein